jgi:hypothetical protein
MMRIGRIRVAVVALATLGLLTVVVGAAPARAQAPWWHLSMRVSPADLPPGGEGTIAVQAINVGDAPTNGPVTLTDVLPAGVTVAEEGGAPSVSLFSFSFAKTKNALPAVLEACHVAGATVSCTTPEPNPERELLPEQVPAIQPYESVEMRFKVKVAPGTPSGLPNRAEVAGGRAPSAVTERPLNIDTAAPLFGVEAFSIIPEEEGGEVDTRAGSHPLQLTATINLNQTADPLKPPALARNLQFKLPPGLVGNATSVPQCSEVNFTDVAEGGVGDECPGNTAIGVASVTIDEPNNFKLVTFPVPLFNLVPAKGEPARFGFEVAHATVTLTTSVRTGADYGVTVSVNNITQLTNFLAATTTFWGVPGDPIHDQSRGWGCLDGNAFLVENSPCEGSTQTNPPPFLTLPTSCAGRFNPIVEGLSWPNRAAPNGASLARQEYLLGDSFGRALGITGCNQLPFDPAIEVAPDVQSASTPTGLKVDVRVPQEVSENPTGLSSSSVKDIAVTFPQGVSVNPASADGLEACSESLVGFTGFEEFNRESEPGSKTALFTPTQASPFCPTASKIGTVRIKVPIIAHPLEGALYLAAQNANPFQTLLAMYIVAEDKDSGVLVKLPGKVTLNEQTGQLTSTFENSPQAPLEDAEIHLFGGSRAPLSTPSHCGAFTTTAVFRPWSGASPATSTSTFDVTSGPNGGSCPGASLPFSPTLTGGTTNISAGAFSPLTTTIGREDGNQDIQSVKLHMPAGLEGILKGVALCPEAQANAGTCGPESEIGKTIVSVGLGGDPFSVTGGKVYLTEKYQGAPFGLSIVNPAVAGPFDLGKVIVRAKIEVDPHTAELTITTGEIPHILDGIPLQIKHVNVTIDRFGFTFNPTNCDPFALTGTISSDEGASPPVSAPFQVTNCAVLKFTPKFTVSTSGRTSKANGASLVTKLAEPPGALGTQANITKVKVELPKQLPSRLTTLQKACTAAQFETNPAGCPAASFIGHATVHTPLLPVPLTGPAIFVSHGGEAFPSLIIVLQGYGVTVDLVGTTFISKAGVTSTTFKTVPDVPFNTFELTLPQGKFSALASNLPATAKGSFCGQKLVMPTEFVAQNGLVIHKNTPVSATGCPKAKKLTRAQKLARAMRACRKKPKANRAACQREARRRYAPLRKRKK